MQYTKFYTEGIFAADSGSGFSPGRGCVQLLFGFIRAIAAVSRKTKVGGYQFWVVGNRRVKGELLLTDQIIAEIADHYQLEHIYTIGRNIINKVMPSLNSPTNENGVKASTMTNEHIVVLRKRAC